MQDWEGASNPDEVPSVRRSSRKRRPPGEWWHDFPAEKRGSAEQTSSDEAHEQKPKGKLEDPSILQDSTPSSSSKSSLGEGYIVDEKDEVGCQADGNEPLHQADSTQEVIELNESDEARCQAGGKEPLCQAALYQGESTQEVIESDDNDEVCCQAVGKEPLYPGESIQEVIDLDAAVVPTPSLLVAAENPVSEKRLKVMNDKGEKTRPENDFVRDVHEGPTPNLTTDNSGYTSSARRQGRAGSNFQAVVSSRSSSWDTTIPASSSLTGHIGVSDESTRTKNRESFRRFSGKVSVESTPTAQQVVARQGGSDPSCDRGSHKPDESDYDTTKEKREGTPKLSDRAKKGSQVTSCMLPEADESLERHRSQNRFSRIPLHGSLDILRVQPQHGTPSITKNVTPPGFVAEPNMRTGELPHVRAPRKSRLKPTSPGYSFNLRSRPGPKPFPWSVINASENQRDSAANTAESTYSRLGVLLTKGTALKHNLVTGHAGAVKVAISISLNQSAVGEILILPRSTTGPRRALTGDEFYVVKRGRAECEVGFTSVTLSAGDHLGIPEGQCFEMRNPSSSNCELYFFSAKTASAYPRAQ